MNPLFSMVTLECRFIDDSIDQKEEDNAIYSDNPGNYVSEVKIFFPVSSLQWLWYKLNTNCILNPSEERCPYHLCIFLSRWTLYHLLWGKGVKKENFISDELLNFPEWETIATSRFWMKNGIEPILSLKM